MNFAFQPSENNDMMHYSKGSQKSGAKYISRKLVNGKWVYQYAKNKINNNKSVQNFKEGYSDASTADSSIKRTKQTDRIHRRIVANNNSEDYKNKTKYLKENESDLKNTMSEKGYNQLLSTSQRLSSKYSEDTKKLDKEIDDKSNIKNTKVYKVGNTIGTVKKKIKNKSK